MPQQVKEDVWIRVLTNPKYLGKESSSVNVRPNNKKDGTTSTAL